VKKREIGGVCVCGASEKGENTLTLLSLHHYYLFILFGFGMGGTFWRYMRGNCWTQSFMLYLPARASANLVFQLDNGSGCVVDVGYRFTYSLAKAETLGAAEVDIMDAT